MNKSTRNLLIVFVVLVAVVYVFFKGKDRISTENIDAKLFVADSSRIDKIEIIKNSESITLEKQGLEWMLTKPVYYSADTSAIAPMLSNLQNFRVENIISTKPEKFPNYLDSVNNTTITVYQEGKDLGTFILGKFALSYENSYIKKPDDDQILLATNLNSTNFTKPSKDYRNKFILAFQAFTVNKIDFRSTDSNMVNYSVVKDTSGKWFIGADSVNPSSMESFLNTFINFLAEDFKDTVITQFPEPTWTISITGNQSYVLKLYKEGWTSNPVYYILQVSGKDQLFRMSEGMAANIMKKQKDLLPPPPSKDDLKKK